MLIAVKKDTLVVRKYEDFALVYNIDTNCYCQINETGFDTLTYLLQNQICSIDDVVHYITKLYDIDEDISEDIISFLEDMSIKSILVAENNDKPSVVSNSSGDNFESVLMEYFLNNNILFSATFELTYSCNEHCIHCYAYDGQNSKPLLTTAEIKKAIDELYDMNCFHIVFTGGDPFIRPDFLEIYNYARDKQFSVDIYTNGIVLSENEDIYRQIVSRKPKGIYMSLYSSSPMIHNKITTVNGSFDKTINAVKKLRRDGINTILNILVMKINLSTIGETIELAKDLDSQYRIGWSISETNVGGKTPLKYRLDNEEDTVQLFKSIDLGIIKNIDDDDYICGAGTSSLTVTPYGDIKACNMLNKSFGNIKEHSIEDIWYKKDTNNFINSLIWNNALQCKNCDNKKYCPHCVANSYNSVGNPFMPNENYCFFAKCIAKCILKQ